MRPQLVDEAGRARTVRSPRQSDTALCIGAMRDKNVKLFNLAVSVLLVCGSTIPTTAEPFFIPTYTTPGTASDAAALADLAPPSRRSTASATYGDAAVASKRSRSARDGAPKFVCVDIGARSDRCPPASRPGIKNTYVFTPAYVSAPTVVGAVPTRASPLHSPFVGFVLDAYGEANRILPTDEGR